MSIQRISEIEIDPPLVDRVDGSLQSASKPSGGRLLRLKLRRNLVDREHCSALSEKKKKASLPTSSGRVDGLATEHVPPDLLYAKIENTSL
ncbi:hypothetical protein [Chenggangzhangella methanolivorans]|uniref:Uncharacterized protein n=1 Tax=Chenggangzhangella methanolivorans TaxID=1437009 RepID=A0A9E6RC44_9HYPH|nr:hypothetical protein [Chenggangzhangella methanolivorans]QZO02093.1 hypothetical protein K6K41_12955 [Chenggangzhangella methanolivorans]